MVFKRLSLVFAFVFVGALIVCSCSKKSEQSEEKATTHEEEEVSYVSEDVSFGVFFDEEGTKRTLSLAKGQKEFKAHLVVYLPEEMGISAVEYRLVLPEGVEIENDKVHVKRNMMIGYYDHGISESFSCEYGPMILIHTWTLQTTTELQNAEIMIMAGEESDFLGVARCEEGHEIVRATSYKAVINPAQ